MSRGPGSRPNTINALKISVVGVSPGIPRVIMGMIAPPMDALFATSAAYTPSGLPCPKVSGSLDALFAIAYDT